MSPESNLPVSSVELKPTAETPPPRKPHAASHSASTSTTSPASGDTLLAALRQTLQQMGIDMNAVQTGSPAVTDPGTSSGGANSSVHGAHATGAKTASQRFLVALYQALVFQHSLSTPLSTGGQSDSDSGSSDTVNAAYNDLGSSLEQLATTARATLPTPPSTSDDWDWQLDDITSFNTVDDIAASSDGPLAELNDALQAYVKPADGNKGGTVSLADVLDGLSNQTKGVRWTPLGLLVDVTI